MIRLTYLLRRKPELSLEEFQQYWRETHGPLAASHAQHMNVLRYVQVHTLPESEGTPPVGGRGEMEPAYDGVAELWWETRDQLATAMETEAGRRAGAALLEDEGRFIDLPQSPLWFNYEYPQINPTPETLLASPRSPYVKLYYPLRHLPTLSFDAAQLYWRTTHGPIIRRFAGGGRILRYQQIHRYDDPLEAALREARGTVVDPYTGHAEVWADRAAWGATPTPEVIASGQAALDDERNFIDFTRSTIWLGKEHQIVDRR